jgi:hypothetical protein
MIMYFHNHETNSIDYELLALYFTLKGIFPNIKVEKDEKDYVTSILI